MDFLLKRKVNWRLLELSLLLGLLAALTWGMWSLHAQRELANKVVRFHILANSDSEADQTLKLQVRDAVLDRAEGILRSAPDRAAAERRLRLALPELERLAEETVRAGGYDYDVTAELTDPAFPTREYDGFTLPAGEYLALGERVALVLIALDVAHETGGTSPQFSGAVAREALQGGERIGQALQLVDGH